MHDYARVSAAKMYCAPDTGWWDDIHIIAMARMLELDRRIREAGKMTAAEIKAKHAQINLMHHISDYTKRNPSVFFGSIKQF